MTRIGVVGTESSHVDQFVRFLNVEHRHGDARIVALAGGDTERNRELTAAGGGLPRVVETPGDLVGVIDAVLICTRDGREHRAEAVPLIEAGLPVFVDKPLAGSAEDAAAIVAAAQAHGVPLYSRSALRFVPGLAELASSGGAAGGVTGGREDPPRKIHVTGPATATGQYGGLYFYGVHLVEAALQLLGDPAEHGAVSVTATPGLVISVMSMPGDVELRLTFVADAVPFHASIVRARSGLAERELTLPPDYTAPLLERFLAMVAKGEPPTDAGAAALLAPIAILDAITAQLD